MKRVKEWVQRNPRKVTQAEFIKIQRGQMIQMLVDSGKTQAEIARELGVSRQNINQLLNISKQKARRKIQYQVKKGYVTVPLHCEGCNLTKQLQAHHNDHDSPLLVNWLCPQCHASIHRHSNGIFSDEDRYKHS